MRPEVEDIALLVSSMVAFGLMLLLIGLVAGLIVIKLDELEQIERINHANDNAGNLHRP